MALDDDEQRSVLAADLDRILDLAAPVLIDEWQRLPPVWDRVRRAVDADPAPGRFLLTGSASPAGQGTHSGAGRIVPLRMRPLALAERWPHQASVSLAGLLAGGRPRLEGTTGVRLGEYVDEILRSGFPGIRLLQGRSLRAQLDGYVDRVIDRDFSELGQTPRNPAGLRRWLAAYAAATSTTATWETIRAAASPGNDRPPAKTTTLPYREILERLYLLDPVPGWMPARNPLKRLTQAPKHHLADPALAARLLGASEATLLDGAGMGPKVPRDGTLLGALFESLVTLSVRVYAQAAEAKVGHLRRFGGDHEIDLIVEREDGAVMAIEVKLTANPEGRDVRHLHWIASELGDQVVDQMIVTTGSTAYRRDDGIAVVPAALLGP